MKAKGSPTSRLTISSSSPFRSSSSSQPRERERSMSWVNRPPSGADDQRVPSEHEPAAIVVAEEPAEEQGEDELLAELRSGRITLRCCGPQTRVQGCPQRLCGAGGLAPERSLLALSSAPPGRSCPASRARSSRTGSSTSRLPGRTCWESSSMKSPPSNADAICRTMTLASARDPAKFAATAGRPALSRLPSTSALPSSYPCREATARAPGESRNADIRRGQGVTDDAREMVEIDRRTCEVLHRPWDRRHGGAHRR